METNTSHELEEFLVIKVSMQIWNICQYIEDAKRESDSGVVSISAENLRRIEDQAHVLLDLAGCIHEKLLQENKFAKPKIRNSSALRLVKKEPLIEYRGVGLEKVLPKLAENSA